MRTLTLAEQETIIRFDAEEKIAHIDTAIPATIRKLDKMVEEYPDTYKCVRVDAEYLAKRYTVLASFIRFGKPASEARKEIGRRAAERLNATVEAVAKTNGQNREFLPSATSGDRL